MDLENQSRIKAAAEKYNIDDIIVVIGSSETEAAGLLAVTVINGAPTFAGPLAGVQLGLNVYLILEEEIKADVDPEIYEAQVSMMETVLDVDKIKDEMTQIRKEFMV